MRLRHFKNAYELSNVGDATLQVIACVILGAGVCEGTVTPEVYAKKLAAVLPQVSCLGEARTAALRSQARAPISALEFAAKVLPFNFR